MKNIGSIDILDTSEKYEYSCDCGRSYKYLS